MREYGYDYEDGLGAGGSLLFTTPEMMALQRAAAAGDITEPVITRPPTPEETGAVRTTSGAVRMYQPYEECPPGKKMAWDGRGYVCVDEAAPTRAGTAGEATLFRPIATDDTWRQAPGVVPGSTQILHPVIPPIQPDLPPAIAIDPAMMLPPAEESVAVAPRAVGAEPASAPSASPTLAAMFQGPLPLVMLAIVAALAIFGKEK